MDMDVAAAFLAGSILYGIGIVFGLACLIAINNMLHKYWKPVKIWMPSYFQEPARFASPDEMDKIAPHLEAQDGKPQEKRNA